MPTHIGIAILFLSAFLAYLCLVWQIWCAGRWLYRWLHPWNEAVDARAREYLVKPHPLWEMDRSFGPLALRQAQPKRQPPAHICPSLPREGSSSPTTAARNQTGEVIPIVLETPLPADTPLKKPTPVESPLVVADGQRARRFPWLGAK